MTEQEQYRMCLGKVRYRVGFAAEGMAEKKGQRAYRCPLCRGWHLTNDSKSRSLARGRA